jgi:hypothetical protein
MQPRSLFIVALQTNAAQIPLYYGAISLVHIHNIILLVGGISVPQGLHYTG